VGANIIRQLLQGFLHALVFRDGEWLFGFGHSCSRAVSPGKNEPGAG
jgi:hypothetical protein